jgi:hypothetical protein
MRGYVRTMKQLHEQIVRFIRENKDYNAVEDGLFYIDVVKSQWPRTNMRIYSFTAGLMDELREKARKKCPNCDGTGRPSCPLCNGTNTPFPEEGEKKA